MHFFINFFEPSTFLLEDITIIFMYVMLRLGKTNKNELGSKM